jgi:hypothetical protein
MTSSKRAESNRCNALKSTGPRTIEGKRRSSLNSIKHGVLSKAPVLAHVESEEEWLAHRGAVFDALQPSNHVEDFLVERIAMQAWRLVRLARYESERLSLNQERVDEDVNEQWLRTHDDLGWPEQARECADFARDGDARISEFIDALEREDLDSLSGQTASWTLELAAEVSGVKGWDGLCEPAWQDCAEPAEFRWTGPLAWEYVQVVANAAGEDARKLLSKAKREATWKWLRAVRKSAAIEKRVARMRVNRLLLGAAGLQTVARYEAHLERSLYRALHEFQRLQGRRSGRKAAAPIDVAGDVSGSI